MRFLGFFLLYCLGIVAQPSVAFAAPGDTTYAAHPVPAVCGHTLTGTLSSGVPIHQLFYADGTNDIVAYATSTQDVYRIQLPMAGYLILKQNPSQAHTLVLGRDSSNRSIIASGVELYPFLNAGTYFLTVDGAAPADYSVVLACNVPPVSVFGDAKLWAEPGTNNGHLTGTLATGANHLDIYRQRSFRRNVFDYKPGAERIFKIELPENRYVRITDRSASPDLFSTYLIDSSGNPLDSLDYLPSGSLAAGIYYLSIEQASSTLSQPYDFLVSTVPVPVTCVPLLDRTRGYTYFDPYGGGLTGSLNGYEFSNPINWTFGLSGSAYVDRYLLDSSEAYLGVYNNVRLMAPAGYVRLYIDFNQDGDFDDGGELVFQPQSRSMLSTSGDWNRLTAGRFFLSDTNESYRAALGKLLRYRVLVTDTNTQGACGHFGFGIATDGRLRLRAAPAAPASFRAMQTLNDIGSATYKEVRPGPQGSMYGAGEAVGLELRPPQVVYQSGLSQISMSDTSQEAAQYYTSGYHHVYMGTANTVTRYDSKGRLVWYRILDGYANDGSIGGTGVVDIAGSAMTPDSGILVLCHLESGIVILQGTDSTTIGESNINFGYDRTKVVRYKADGRVSMAHDFANAQAFFNPLSSGHGRDGSFFFFGSAGSILRPGFPNIRGPLGDTLALNPRGSQDAVLLQMLPNNRLGWMVKVEGATQQTGVKMSFGASGRLYIVGTFDTAATVVSTASATTLSLRGQGPHSGYLVALSDSGRPLWSRTWSLSDANWVRNYTSTFSVPLQLAVDASGQNIVITGGFKDRVSIDSTVLRSEGGLDGYGLGFGSDGSLRWATSFGTQEDETVTALSPDPGGKLVASVSYKRSVDRVFRYGRLSSTGEDNVGLLQIDPATGQVGRGIGFAQFSGYGARINGLHALPGGKLLLAGATSGQSLLRGWGVVSSGGFIGMADLTVDTVRYAGPTAVQIAENSLRRLDVYPNPSTGRVYVRNEQATGRMPVTVLDAQGRVVLRAEGEGAELRAGYVLPIRLQPGFYLVRCGERSCRMVVE